MPLFEYQCRNCGRLFEVFTQRPEPTARMNGDVPLKY